MELKELAEILAGKKYEAVRYSSNVLCYFNGKAYQLICNYLSQYEIGLGDIALRESYEWNLMSGTKNPTSGPIILESAVYTFIVQLLANSA